MTARIYFPYIFFKEKKGGLLTLFPVCVADILNLSNKLVERNLAGSKEKHPSLDCIERDMDMLFLTICKFFVFYLETSMIKYLISYSQKSTLNI